MVGAPGPKVDDVGTSSWLEKDGAAGTRMVASQSSSRSVMMFAAAWASAWLAPDAKLKLTMPSPIE